MSVLTIFGNGLDLAHGLRTRFDDFMKTLPIEQQEKYSVFRNKDNSWNCVESKYEELLRTIMDSREWKTVIDEVDCIRDGYGYNEYGEIDYYGYDFDGCDKELDEISDLISLLKDFENDFWEYLKLRCNDEILNDVSPIKSIFEIVRQSSRIVTFNYTHTLEILYGAKNTIHIHGDIDDSIAIGSGAMEEAKTTKVDYEYPKPGDFSNDKEGLVERQAYYTYDSNGRLVEEPVLKSFFDDAVASANKKENELFNLLETKSKDSLEERKHIIDTLAGEHYDMVYVIGHSLGRADLNVFKAINKDAYVVCTYHFDTERSEREEILRRLGFECEMISDKKMYV